MEPDDLLCSRNARPQKALVGCAQWKINQPPSLKRERASLGGRVPTLVLCSRNARPQKGLVRRPHLGQHGYPSPRERQRASVEGASVYQLYVSANLAGLLAQTGFREAQFITKA
jgi:hypothetical protein